MKKYLMKAWIVAYKQADSIGKKIYFDNEIEAENFYNYIKSLGPEYRIEFVDMVYYPFMATSLYIKRKFENTPDDIQPKV